MPGTQNWPLLSLMLAKMHNKTQIVGDGLCGVLKYTSGRKQGISAAS